MKIGFVLDDTLDTSDGVQQYVLLVGKWLHDQGHDVHYLVGETARRDIPNIHSLSRNKRVSFNKNTLSIPFKVEKDKLKRLIEDNTWDVLHVQMPYSPILAGRVIKYAPPDTAVVGTFHIAPHDTLVALSTSALGFVNKRSLKRFNAVVSVSEVARDFALHTFKVHSRVIPNAIDAALWRPLNAKRTCDVAFVGRLVERKGCKLLLRALARIVADKKFSNISVKIAGDGPQRRDLEAYVLEHKLQDNVEFLGFISEGEKRRLLHSTRIAVYPSTGGESFGIVLIEAMAAGALVLGGSNPGYSTVLRDVPETLFKLEPTVIARLIGQYLHDKAMYERLVKSQQDTLKRFDINTVGNDILKVYKKAISDVPKK